MVQILDLSAPRGLHRHALAVVETLAEHMRHVYLVLHNIDGAGLRSTEAQDVLALLAASPFVHFIATVDHVRATLCRFTSATIMHQIGACG